MKNSALLHVKSCSDMTDIAEEVLALCSEDLISSEAKYHASCYKSFVRICYDGTESGTPKSIDNPSDPLFEAVEEFCSEVIRSPRVVEFKTIRKVMSDEAEKLGTELSSSSYKNLLRKISKRFKELNFVHQSHNNVLVYPNNLKVEDPILQNSKMKSELETMNHLMGDDTASVIKVAKILPDTILAHPEQMSWPPLSCLIKLKCIFLTYLTFSAVHSYQVNQEQVRAQELQDLKKFDSTRHCLLCLRRKN